MSVLLMWKAYQVIEALAKQHGWHHCPAYERLIVQNLKLYHIMEREEEEDHWNADGRVVERRRGPRSCPRRHISAADFMRELTDQAIYYRPVELQWVIYTGGLAISSRGLSRYKSTIQCSIFTMFELDLAALPPEPFWMRMILKMHKLHTPAMSFNADL
ncbi:hypothetical protein BT63DRAFT_476576 [Microthyrium microscopicum]|uniref:Uncharacterized protein n=1 Tax=Microthyrium microscopicum TaxID=703497 RepID=A0A6A6UJ30_9PEZI|nr:hypothetical protein BT63DRAFT_476576 [Microthyrium microscopicum]